MQAYTTGKPAVMYDATLERRWEITLTFVDVQIRSCLSARWSWAAARSGSLPGVR